MSHAIVYHWWCEKCDLPPMQNMRCSIIPSIATLRGVNPDVPIYVLDLTEHDVDWGRCPELLDFKVRKIKPSIKSTKPGYKYLSRIIDVWEFCKTQPETIWVYNDCDVFWLRDPFPLAGDVERFCFNRYNSGFYYFDKTSAMIETFMETFRALCLSCLYDENYWYIVRQYGYLSPTHYLADEAVLQYMYNKPEDQFFNLIPPEEHFTVDWFHENYGKITDLSLVKMLHCNGLMVENPISRDPYAIKHSRGLATLIIEELYQNLRKLDFDILPEMFTKEEIGLFGRRIHFDLAGIKMITDTRSILGVCKQFSLSRAIGVKI